MFGYVTPYKMELKIKDYEKFKAYYCGLCTSIKKCFGNLPRITLNYDMTFLAVLLDSLHETKNTYIKAHCIVHPMKKRIMIIDNDALDYAAFCNVILVYYKLLDDVKDENSLKSSLYSKFLDLYIKKHQNNYIDTKIYIEKRLKELYNLEENPQSKTLDELSHPFGDLTGFLISNYSNNDSIKFDLYWLGYNLGKWIYIIDAWNDLEEDIKQNRFNAINNTLNTNNLTTEIFMNSVKERIDFTLTICAQQCYECFNKLDLIKNKELLENILHLGLVEKMNTVFKRSEKNA